MSKLSGLLQTKQALPSSSEVVSQPVEHQVTQSEQAGTAAPRGKKGYADYNLNKNTHNKAKIELLQRGHDQDLG